MINLTHAPATAPSESNRRLALIAFGLGLVVATITAAVLLGSGTKMSMVLAFGLAAAPIAIYIAIRQPFIFPFGLYAALVPFNHLVVIHGFGTMTKLAGVASGVALLFYILRTKRVARPSTALFAWLAFVTWACMSAAWAAHPETSLGLINILLQLFFLFAVTAIAPIDSTELRWLLAAIAAGGVAAAAYGGKLFLGGTQTLDNRLFIDSANAGEYLDPNHFAAALLLPIAIVLVWALEVRGLLAKLGLFAAFGVLMVGVYASGSRGALVAIVAIICYLFVRTRHRLALASLAVLGAGVSLAIKSSMWTRFLADVGTGSGRTSIWSVGIHAFMNHPVIGVGVATFADAYNRLLMKYFISLYAPWDRAAHNIILMVAVELGIVGLALLAWALVAQWRALSVIRPDNGLFSVRVALEGAFIGLICASLFLDTLYWKYAWLTFSVMLLARSAALSPAAVQAPARIAARPLANGRPARTVVRA
jgi:putative inorganic carbon (hco3(-)) transporter